MPEPTAPGPRGAREAVEVRGEHGPRDRGREHDVEDEPGRVERLGRRRDRREVRRGERRERDEEDVRRNREDDGGEPRLDPRDPGMAEDREDHDDRLAQHGEDDRVGEAGQRGDDVVERDPGEHRLHPAPPHQDDHVRGDRQEAAAGAERPPGQRHRRKAGAGADRADEHQHRRADHRAADDQGEHEPVRDIGHEQGSGQQRRDDEVGGQPDHQHPAGGVRAAHGSGVVGLLLQTLLEAGVERHLRAPSGLSGYADAARGAAERLRKRREVLVHGEQVIVVSGEHDGLALPVRLGAVGGLDGGVDGVGEDRAAGEHLHASVGRGARRDAPALAEPLRPEPLVGGAVIQSRRFGVEDEGRVGGEAAEVPVGVGRGEGVDDGGCRGGDGFGGRRVHRVSFTRRAAPWR